MTLATITRTHIILAIAGLCAAVTPFAWWLA
jgi:hypothetical protein